MTGMCLNADMKNGVLGWIFIWAFITLASQVEGDIRPTNLGGSASAIESRIIKCWDGDLPLDGILEYDTSRDGKRPGVLVVDESWGVNDQPEQHARQLAQMGYVALAADLYGKKGMTGNKPESRAQIAGSVPSDRDAMRLRLALALSVLKGDSHVDPKRIIMIGYCFGDTRVLELAHGNTELAGVVNFYGGHDKP